MKIGPLRLAASLSLLLAATIAVRPAMATPVALVCAYEDGRFPVTLRIDYATGVVEQLRDTGEPQYRATGAQVTASAIVWNYTEPQIGNYADGRRYNTVFHFWGRIDRSTGAGEIQIYRDETYGEKPDRIRCRLAPETKF